MKKETPRFVVNRYKGTLIRIMRDTETKESERKEASRLYMLKLISPAQESWINKYVRKYKKDENN